MSVCVSTHSSSKDVKQILCSLIVTHSTFACTHCTYTLIALVALFALRLPESASHELPTTIAECNKMDQDSLSSYEDKSSEEADGDVTAKTNGLEDNSGKFNYSVKF